VKVVGLQEFGGPDVLRVMDVPTPEPGAGEVRVRVHAVAVNPTDTLFRSGALRERLRDREPPFVPGMDAAGVIDAVGAGVGSQLQVGDSVITLAVPASPNRGSYAEQIVVSAASVVIAPRGVDIIAASTLMMNALTARLALDSLALTHGTRLLVTGAAGALGGYVLQLAAAQGLRPIADAAPRDRVLVEELGAVEVVDRGDDVADRVRARFPDGVSGAVDCALLGELVFPAIRDHGALAVVRPAELQAVRGISVHPIQVSLHAHRTDLMTALRDAAERGELRLRVADVLPARDAARAHERLAAGGLRGRLVLDFRDGCL
jgi:NADPH:quinone reductase